jgi:hypothetical protein
MHKNNKTSGRSFGAFRWSVIALAVGLAVCLSVHAQRTATATATVVKGFVVAITVTDGGSGYPVPPLVSISGGGGSGAGAEASVSGGVVVAIAVTATGRGYTSVPDVVIAAPPPPEAPVLKSVRLASAITIEGSLGTTNWILWADVLDTCPYTWRVLTNVVVTTSPYVVMDWEATPQQRFYQASSGPQPQVFAPDSNRWVWIPAGTFTMGSPASEQDRDSDEGPQTQVTISRGFWLGRHEVTQAEYQAVIGSNPSYFTGDANRPVEQVSWIDATNYCAKVTAAEQAAGRLPAGWVYRLPTEAEWEYRPLDIVPFSHCVVRGAFGRRSPLP